MSTNKWFEEQLKHFSITIYLWLCVCLTHKNYHSYAFVYFSEKRITIKESFQE